MTTAPVPMRRWMAGVVGAVAVTAFAAGCSTTISGSPQVEAGGQQSSSRHAPPSGTSIPPSTGASASEEPHEANGVVTAACPLLPAADVGKPWGKTDIEPVEAEPDKHPHRVGFTCNYKSGGNLITSVLVIDVPQAQAEPQEYADSARGVCGGKKTEVSGAGDYAYTCSGTHEGMAVAVAAKRVGTDVVTLSVMVPDIKGKNPAPNLLREAAGNVTDR